MTVRKSETIAKLAEALAKAQSAMRVAIKDSVNPHFKSSYANLASVWEAVREPLTANGLAVIQSPTGRGAEVVVTTTLTHSSGEWLESDFTLTAQQNTPQGIVSAVTYGRRTALAAIAGIAPDEDDDGEAAHGRGVPNDGVIRKAAPPPPPRPAPAPVKRDEPPPSVKTTAYATVDFPIGGTDEEEARTAMIEADKREASVDVATLQAVLHIAYPGDEGKPQRRAFATTHRCTKGNSPYGGFAGMTRADRHSIIEKARKLIPAVDAGDVVPF